MAPDALAFSFWAARLLPVAGLARLQLLGAESASARLRCILDLCAKGGLTDLECVGCGVTIADAVDVFSMPHSEGALSTFANVSMTFKLVTLRRMRPGACLARGPVEASTERTWFPGFAWSPLTCSTCRSHLGWAYTFVGELELSETTRVLTWLEGAAARAAFRARERGAAAGGSGDGDDRSSGGSSGGSGSGGSSSGGDSGEEGSREERSGPAASAPSATAAAASESWAVLLRFSAGAAAAAGGGGGGGGGDGDGGRGRGFRAEPLDSALPPPPTGVPRFFVGLASGACVAFKRRETDSELLQLPPLVFRRSFAPSLSERSRFVATLPR